MPGFVNMSRGGVVGKHRGVLSLFGALAESCEQRGVGTKPLPAANGKHNADNSPYEPHWNVPLTESEERDEAND
jgi:hypothetical protein